VRSQSSYKLKRTICGSVAFRIRSPNFSTWQNRSKHLKKGLTKDTESAEKSYSADGYESPQGGNKSTPPEHSTYIYDIILCVPMVIKVADVHHGYATMLSRYTMISLP
jgi:hypothetical protein